MADTRNSPTYLMSSIRSKVDELNGKIKEHASAATVYTIQPYAPMADKFTLVPDLIDSTRVDGSEAIERAQIALRDFSRHQYQHPSNVMRLPGTVCTNRDLSTLVNSINQLKKQLKECIKDTCPNSRSRNVYCKNEFPGRVMLQVYRQIYLINKPVLSVNYAWSPFTNSMKNLNRMETLDILMKRHATKIDRTDENRHAALEIAIGMVIKSSEDTNYVIKKPRAPHPIIKINYDTSDTTIIAASLPLILGPDTEINSTDIGTLPVYTKAGRRKTRADKIQTKLLFKPLYLYSRLY